MRETEVEQKGDILGLVSVLKVVIINCNVLIAPLQNLV